MCGCPDGQYRRYSSYAYECSYEAPAYSTEAPYHATKAPAYPPHTTKYTTRPPPPPYCPPGTWLNKVTGECDCQHGYVLNQKTYQCDCPEGLVITSDKKLGHVVCGCPKGQRVTYGPHLYRCTYGPAHSQCARTCEYGYTLNEKTCTCERDQPSCSCVPRGRGSAGHCAGNDEYSCNRLSAYCKWRCDY